MIIWRGGRDHKGCYWEMKTAPGKQTPLQTKPWMKLAEPEKLLTIIDVVVGGTTDPLAIQKTLAIADIAEETHGTRSHCNNLEDQIRAKNSL